MILRLIVVDLVLVNGDTSVEIKNNFCIVFYSVNISVIKHLEYVLLIGGFFFVVVVFVVFVCLFVCLFVF